MPGVQRIAGRAVAIDRDDIDTDQIIPAAWLKRVERTGFAPGLFGAWREDPGFALNRPGAAGAKVLVAGDNFGCGSSREHAVWALQDFGDVAARTVGIPSAGIEEPFELPDFARWRLLEGLDDIALTLRHADAIAAYEAGRPSWLPAQEPARPASPLN